MALAQANARGGGTDGTDIVYCPSPANKERLYLYIALRALRCPWQRGSADYLGKTPGRSRKGGQRHKLPTQPQPSLHGRAGPPKRGSGVPGGKGAEASGGFRNQPSLPSAISSSPSGALGSQSAVTAFPGGGKGGRQGGAVKREPPEVSRGPQGTSPQGRGPPTEHKRTRIKTETGLKSKSGVILVISRNPADLLLPCPLGPPVSLTPP